jgi:hypothetical protein
VDTAATLFEVITTWRPMRRPTPQHGDGIRRRPARTQDRCQLARRYVSGHGEPKLVAFLEPVSQAFGQTGMGVGLDLPIFRLEGEQWVPAIDSPGSPPARREEIVEPAIVQPIDQATHENHYARHRVPDGPGESCLSPARRSAGTTHRSGRFYITSSDGCLPRTAVRPELFWR